MALRFQLEVAEGMRPPEEATHGLPRLPTRRVREYAEKYAGRQWCLTQVVRKQKKGFKTQFVALRKVRLPCGRTIWCKGGTEKIDGHWALIRRQSYRSAFRTDRREDLRQLVGVNQWRYWLGTGVDKFHSLGPALRQERRHLEVAMTEHMREAQRSSHARARAAAGEVARRKRLRPCTDSAPVADGMTEAAPFAPAGEGVAPEHRAAPSGREVPASSAALPAERCAGTGRASASAQGAPMPAPLARAGPPVHNSYWPRKLRQRG